MSNNFQKVVDFVEEEFSNHTEIVREEVIDIFNLEAGTIGSILNKTQSPIEADFGLKLYRQLNETSKNIGFCTLGVQQKITVCDPLSPDTENNYVADFVVTFQPEDGSNDQVEIVIECDGHDYHERTKQQARKDRKRDRYMNYAGYKVLRFTGAEIHDSCHECVEEVIEHLSFLESKARGLS